MMTPQLTATEAAKGLAQFNAASEAGRKVFYGPLYSAIDLLGIALAKAPTTAQLPASVSSFFQASEGQIGQGFSRGARLSETNLDGAPGQLPAGYAFLGHSLGLFLPPQLPPQLKDHLTRHAAIKHVRHSHVWKCGAIVFWPSGEFGHVSQSAATTVSDTIIQYGVNGKAGMRQLPRGAELYFPSKEVIKFDFEVYEPVFVTTDGLPANGGEAGVDPGGNQLSTTDGALVYLVMDGYRFELLTA